MADTTHMHAKLGLGRHTEMEEKVYFRNCFYIYFHQIIPIAHPCMHKTIFLMRLGS